MKKVRKLQKGVYHKVHNYIVGDEIDKGSFSTIREAFRVDCQNEFAFKIISKKKIMCCEESSDMLFSDSVLSLLLHHPHVVQTFQVIESQHQFFHVMDYFPSGSLLTYVTSHNLPLREKLFLLDQLLSAIEYMHNHYLCHRDIKPENILMSQGDSAFLTDFEFTSLAIGCNNRGKCGSYGYAAPEVFLNMEYDGKKADVWSIGVLAYSTFSGKFPFPNDESVSPHVYVDYINYSILPEVIQSFVQDCLQVNPEKRPTVSQLRSYSCFDGCKRGAVNQRPDLVSPVNELDYGVVSKLSEFLHVYPEEIKKPLAEKGVNVEKILYTLQKESLAAQDVAFPFKVPNFRCFKIYKMEVDDSIFKVISSVNYELLSEKYTISSTTYLQKIAVLNTMQDDISLKINFEDIPGDKKCTVSVECNIPSQQHAENLLRFISSTFSARSLT